MTNVQKDNLIPWPSTGVDYPTVFEVSCVGPLSIDEPTYTLRDSSKDLTLIFADHAFSEIIHPHDTPIASGAYSCNLRFWQNYKVDWESDNREDEYGFDLTQLKKVN
jgi:hypothetical protein